MSSQVSPFLDLLSLLLATVLVVLEAWASPVQICQGLSLPSPAWVKSKLLGCWGRGCFQPGSSSWSTPPSQPESFRAFVGQIILLLICNPLCSAKVITIPPSAFHLLKMNGTNANKHMKSCSTSLIIRKMKIKTMKRDHLTTIRLTTMKKSVGKDVEKTEPCALLM